MDRSNITGWMFSFFSRIWCFHHVNTLLLGKPTVFISVGLYSEEDNYGSKIYESTVLRGRSKFEILDEIYYQSTNPPCLNCGEGGHCQKGGLWNMVGQSEEALKNFTFTPDKYSRWENNPKIIEQVGAAGAKLAAV